ncbi:MAG: exodeoxyribonuclease VII small subunit [Methylohalobius sp. ZOD2]|nr:exodeoxyribonuclease VII small subunit [Methylothermaceae bacterium]
MAKRKPGFETQLKELEQIVERLEAGDVSLEDSLKLFEKGVQLARNCQQALQDAEQKVQILTQDDSGEAQLQPFQIDDEH